ncbi:CcdB family protein [Dokdonella soli]|uniref:Toxin CcdB n=1 Tax=Dokdonella soli TaxID=529810 RepID=A0ABN1IF07_9GAMM
MARFDVYRNESAQSAKRFPYFLVVQSDLLDGLSTTVVVPLGKPGVVGGRLAQTLTPALDVDGEALVMYTPELAAVHATVLRKRVGNLEGQRGAILRALDFLFSGI